MNTKIGTTFGLALLVAIGAIAVMFAMGMFNAKPASAGLGTITAQVVPLPTKARSIAQYTILVTGASGSGMNAIPVGGTITLTFQSGTTVPSAIAVADVTLKASLVSNGSDGNAGAANQLANASAVTVSGQAITITVPDMVTGTDAGNIGDNGIAADGGVTITLSQNAGIQNPNKAGTSFEIGVVTSTNATSVDTTSYTIISFVSIDPSSAARGTTLTVTGGGFTSDCANCQIHFNHDNDTSVKPTTGNFGSGTIDANGVFSGTVALDSTTSAGGYVWIIDSVEGVQVSSSKFVQKAGATPTKTSISSGSTLSVDLVDFTPGATFSTSDSAQIGNTNATSSNVTTVPSSGNTAGATPYKIAIPGSQINGTFKITITESVLGTKSASFDIEIVSRLLTVTPSTASPGQLINIKGTGFTGGATIAEDKLTAKASGETVSADVNHTSDDVISIDADGDWNFATRMPTLAVLADNDEKVTITADDGTLTGVTSGFLRTKRTVTLTPSTAGPGSAVVVSVTGFTVDNGENSVNAEFSVASDKVTLTGTVKFPVGTDGTGSGTITIPITETNGTVAITVTDNALALNPTLAATKAGQNQSASADLKVPKGTITISPASASTGNLVTITGSDFPSNSAGTSLKFASASGLPSSGFITDATGGFEITIEVPAATGGGSLAPGTKFVEIKVGQITGDTTAFEVPQPSIVITPSSAAVEDIVVITGTGFNSLGTATVLTIGSASALPSPAPRAERNGDITATITIPLLNPGTYTVVLTNSETGGTVFSATGTFVALAATVPAAASTDATEDVFADVIANNNNLVIVWRFSNASKEWSLFNPEFLGTDFEDANDLVKTGAGDIVWVRVNTEQAFPGATPSTLSPGWNLVVLN